MSQSNPNNRAKGIIQEAKTEQSWQWSHERNKTMTKKCSVRQVDWQYFAMAC